MGIYHFCFLTVAISLVWLVHVCLGSILCGAVGLKKEHNSDFGRLCVTELEKSGKGGSGLNVVKLSFLLSQKVLLITKGKAKTPRFKTALLPGVLVCTWWCSRSGRIPQSPHSACSTYSQMYGGHFA